MVERLQKYIARCGAASRRRAESLIAQGRVTVNGEVLTDKVCVIDPERDKVALDGVALSLESATVYYALYKPRGYHCTVEDRHADKKVTELVPPAPRVFPVGRLDKDSEGLIILTNDGETALHLTHPRFEHEKEYVVEARTAVERSAVEVEDAVAKMARGVEIETGKTLPSVIEILDLSGKSVRLRIILKEGKKRQIRRMCRAVDLKVVRLIRTRIGRLKLENLKPGEYRIFSKDEIF